MSITLKKFDEKKNNHTSKYYEKRIEELNKKLQLKDHEIGYLKRKIEQIKEISEKTLEPYYNEKK